MVVLFKVEILVPITVGMVVSFKIQILVPITVGMMVPITVGMRSHSK